MYGRYDIPMHIERPDLFDHRAVTDNEITVHIRGDDPASRRRTVRPEKALGGKIKGSWRREEVCGSYP